jgi:hypothetical protein
MPRKSTKSQALAFARAPALRKPSGGGASHKQAKFQTKSVWLFEFGTWSLFGIWNLGFEILGAPGFMIFVLFA